MKINKEQSKSLSSEQAEEYLFLLNFENTELNLLEFKECLLQNFFITAVQKRIEVFKLPIKFNDYALACIPIFCDRIGAAIVFLIDCLEEFENEEVTANKIAEIYPWGFYNEEFFKERVNSLKYKEGKSKWEKIY